MQLLWDGGMKVCSNGPGHMTKMVAMPIYGKNLKKSSPEPKGLWPWILVCIIRCSSITKFAQMMILGWRWSILRQGQIWSLMLLYGKKVKQWIFQKLFSCYDLNLATDDRSDIKTLSPGAVFPLPPGYRHVLNHEKKCIKSDFKEILWNLQQMGKVIRPFCWSQNFVPWGLSLPRGYIHVLNHEKNCIKSDFKDIFLKQATNECPGAIHV